MFFFFSDKILVATIAVDERMINIAISLPFQSSMTRLVMQ